MKYQINMVRYLRQQEKTAQRKRVQMIMLGVACFGVLALAAFYSALNVLSMRDELDEERQRLSRIKAEYRQYKATKQIVDKADIELLDRLQNGRIFWTKKLASMAYHLPENYWVTSFAYRQRGKGSFDVDGYGYITPRQEQLITVDDYLNLLREDTTFNDVFRTVYFNSTTRSDEGRRERVTFDYSAIGKK